jgi:hypothetical protein
MRGLELAAGAAGAFQGMKWVYHSGALPHSSDLFKKALTAAPALVDEYSTLFRTPLATATHWLDL